MSDWPHFKGLNVPGDGTFLLFAAPCLASTAVGTPLRSGYERAVPTGCACSWADQPRMAS